MISFYFVYDNVTKKKRLSNELSNALCVFKYITLLYIHSNTLVFIFRQKVFMFNNNDINIYNSTRYVSVVTFITYVNTQ